MDTRQTIWDPIRKKNVALTPEERVRQWCIGILADHYGMTNISKIHGAVLSAWGVAGLVGNQAAILVSDGLGFGYGGVVTMLVILYSLNFLNALTLCRRG